MYNSVDSSSETPAWTFKWKVTGALAFLLVVGLAGTAVMDAQGGDPILEQHVAIEEGNDLNVDPVGDFHFGSNLCKVNIYRGPRNIKRKCQRKIGAGTTRSLKFWYKHSMGGTRRGHGLQRQKYRLLAQSYLMQMKACNAPPHSSKRAVCRFMAKANTQYARNSELILFAKSSPVPKLRKRFKKNARAATHLGNAYKSLAKAKAEGNRIKKMRLEFRCFIQYHTALAVSSPRNRQSIRNKQPPCFR